MKLSTRQAGALETWCNSGVIDFLATPCADCIGRRRTIKALCKRRLICAVDLGFRPQRYTLTASGVAELRLRGFKAEVDDA